MDTNWCSFCDKAVSPYSNSLYCSDECFQKDALQSHPMLSFNVNDCRMAFFNERDRHHSHQASSTTLSEDNHALSTSCGGAAPSLSSSCASSSYLSVKSSFAVATGPIATPLPSTQPHVMMGRKYVQYSLARPLPTSPAAVASETHLCLPPS
ncbi:hypothetical protein BX666DRAFT_773316 [Dichotomocladium elegans]|nr:hypothetical protein BX666DRAFT_773316 [Dichotomocladium elegans]